jgi:hypothetical protein
MENTMSDRAAQVTATLTRAKAAFTTQGVLVDALHAWIDFAHTDCLSTDNEDGMRFYAGWSHAVHHATRHGTRGTMRAWFEAHKGAPVDTVQVHQDGQVWWPQGRVINDVRATFAEIEGSRRHYSEARVITQSADTLIIATESAICAYWAVTEEDAP